MQITQKDPDQSDELHNFKKQFQEHLENINFYGKKLLATHKKLYPGQLLSSIYWQLSFHFQSTQ